MKRRKERREGGIGGFHFGRWLWFSRYPDHDERELQIGPLFAYWSQPSERDNRRQVLVHISGYGFDAMVKRVER